MPGFKNIEKNSEILLHICSFLDLHSLVRMSMVSKPIRNTVRTSFRIGAWNKMRDIMSKSLLEFQQLTKSTPKKTNEGGIIADVYQLQLFHIIIQMVLDIVNQKMGDRDLNIVSGEELLHSVGRLSMMIAEADYLPGDTRAVPLNWTKCVYLKERTKLDPKKIPKILRNLNNNAKALAKPSRSLANYQRDVSYRIFDMIAQAVYKKIHSVGNRTELLNSDAPALDLIPWRCAQNIVSYLDADDLRRLALVNRRFLVLIGLTPPSCLLQDRYRSAAVAECAKAAARLVRNKGLKVPGLSKKEHNLLYNEVSQKLLKDFNKAIRANEVIKAMNKKGFRNMELRWGNGNALALADTGSVRLIFSQALEIMHAIGDTTSTALDLSYERIVKYLQLNPPEKIYQQMTHAMVNPKAVDEAFFGELAILLVGIEGSQNNFTVLHAPMIMDLACTGVISWEQALFQRSGIPYFVMAGDKSEKGASPMVRHSQIIRYGRLSKQELKKADVKKFNQFLGKEIDLHSLFFSVFFPELADYDRPTQLLLSCIIAKNYLCESFGLTIKARDLLKVKLMSLLELYGYGKSFGMFKSTNGGNCNTKSSFSRKPKSSTPMREFHDLSMKKNSRWSMIPIHKQMQIGLERLKALTVGTHVQVMSSDGKHAIAIGEIDWEYGDTMSIKFITVLDKNDWLFTSNNWWKSGLKYDKASPTIQLMD